MKKTLFISLAILPALLGTSCKDEVRQLNVYRKPGEVDKQITVRFFKDSPNVPYISVSEYYKEFFDVSLKKVHNISTGFEYMYITNSNEYMSFSTNKHTFTTSGMTSFDNNPNYSSVKGKLFIKYENVEATKRQIKTINLKNYGIKLYARQKDAYVPLTLLSDLSGGLSGFDVVYNGKDIYVFDNNGYLGTETNASSFGTSYLSELNDVNTPRKEDLVKFNYNELCLVFDHLRGHTKQLVFGDEKLESLGLDKLLSTYHPKIKEYLLSTNKLNYYEGLAALFHGLADGGHTGLTFGFDKFIEAVNRKSEKDFADLLDIYNDDAADYTGSKTSFQISKRTVLGVPLADKKYYYYSSDDKTAFIGFNNFSLDINGWDDYYNGRGEIPVDTDSYAYVRQQMYQAKSDGAENVVLDLTTNTGGSSYSLEGILSLFNKAKGYIHTLDVVGGYTVKENHLIDINLDGKWDEKDKEEAEKFNFNVGVLTSDVAFSCGNLLPFNMKELGYKIIGEKSGGGSCAVSKDTTADGIPYAHSSYLCLTDAQGDNIDGGVPVDFPISRVTLSEHLYNCDTFFDITSVAEYLSNAYTN